LFLDRVQEHDGTGTARLEAPGSRRNGFVHEQGRWFTFSLIQASLRMASVKTAFLVVGAALLVAGASLIALAPFYVSTGFYKEELKTIQEETNSSVTPSNIYSTYSSYADTGNWIAIAGAIIAPVGAVLLAYGLSAKETEEKENQVEPAAEPVQG